jgi:hypothetical protein
MKLEPMYRSLSTHSSTVTLVMYKEAEFFETHEVYSETREVRVYVRQARIRLLVRWRGYGARRVLRDS